MTICFTGLDLTKQKDLRLIQHISEAAESKQIKLDVSNTLIQ